MENPFKLTENKDTKAQRAAAVATLRAEALEVLTKNILPFWLDKMVDEEHGGFYGQMTGRYELNKEADKGAILNARILWALSAAYRVLSSVECRVDSVEFATAHKSLECRVESVEFATAHDASTNGSAVANSKLYTLNSKLKGSAVANSKLYTLNSTLKSVKDYFIEHFIDPDYGGVYWSVDYLGRPKDTKKQFYAIGFAIYALSEYARATGDREALDYALQLYDCIEEHAFDPVNNGYIEACTREWGTIADMRLSELDQNYPKSQNTHLHIIEPYTNLYRCLQEFHAAESCSYVPAIGSILPIDVTVPQETVSLVAASLRNLINIFTDRILNPETHHLDLFFDMDWTRRGGRLESYGHDIECSWLLHEAALVLGDEQMLQKVEPVVRMVAQASEKGLRPDGSMIHEANLDTGHTDDDLHWWVQAENVVGQINLYQHFGDQDALRKALRCWEYIKHSLIDREHGEWYWSRHADGSLNLDDDHAGFWKCPYHNSRMCLEVIERFPAP